VLLKHFRELGKDIRPELYSASAFTAPGLESMDFWRDYRLRDIVGDDVFNRAHQSLDAFVRSSYAFFQDDLGSAIRVALEGGKEKEISASREKIVDRYLAEIQKLNEEANRYYVLLGELQAVSALLQRERFGFRTFKRLPQRSEIQRSVATLRKLFGDSESSTAQGARA
jgi:hypothetical protein